MNASTRKENIRRVLCVICSIFLHVVVYSKYSERNDPATPVHRSEFVTVTLVPRPVTSEKTLEAKVTTGVQKTKIVKTVQVSDKSRNTYSAKFIPIVVGPMKPPVEKVAEGNQPVPVKKIDWGSVREVVSASAGSASFTQAGYNPGSTMLSPRDEYVRDCRGKVSRVGNFSNRAKFNGRVIVEVSIRPNGKIEKVTTIRSSDLPENLYSSAEEVVKNASPFAEFPPALLETTKLVSFTVCNRVKNKIRFV